MSYYVHDLHFSDYCPHFCRHVYHNVSAVWRKKGDHRPLWDQAEILNKEHHWKICKLKESAHMLDHKNLLSRPSIEINTIWEPVINSAREKQ